MNDQQRAAMQMALEALIANLRGTSGRFPLTNEAITALREALAQQDKPHVVRDGGNWGMSPRYKCSGCDDEFRSEHRAHWHCQNECKALAQPQCNQHPDAPHGFDRNASHSADRYVCECESWEQPQGEWVDLTDDDWNAIDVEIIAPIDSRDIETIGKAAIAKFKEKNTQPVVPQGEPVAWMHTFMGVAQINTTPPEFYGKDWTHQPLYTTPPVVSQGEPVGYLVYSLDGVNFQDSYCEGAEPVYTAPPSVEAEKEKQNV